ncbi:MAG: hypothetical protein HKO65_16455 [Gemmatimonadetes bacterium]|nr:hypothetical protein [Gemmatimonadota bacterium]NNM06688.1 hypothetical protein [Gemmatimonadota bacterium]
MPEQSTSSFLKGFSFVMVMLAVVLVVGFVQVSVDQADERTALQMILADLETDSVEMTAVRNRGQATDERVLWILRNMDAPQDSIRPRLMNLFYYTSYQQVRTGYDNLLNAGRLTVITHPELRQELVRYYEVTHPYMWEFYEMYMTVYREFKETTAPYLFMGAEREGEALRTSYTMEWVRPWSEMKSDPHFRYKLSEIGVGGSQFAFRLDSVLETNAELRATIQAEMGM